MGQGSEFRAGPEVVEPRLAEPRACDRTSAGAKPKKPQPESHSNHLG